MRPAQVCAWMKQQANANMLYEQLPVVVFPGHDLQVSLHNLPVNQCGRVGGFCFELRKSSFCCGKKYCIPARYLMVLSVNYFANS